MKVRNGRPNFDWHMRWIPLIDLTPSRVLFTKYAKRFRRSGRFVQFYLCWQSWYSLSPPNESGSNPLRSISRAQLYIYKISPLRARASTIFVVYGLANLSIAVFTRQNLGRSSRLRLVAHMFTVLFRMFDIPMAGILLFFIVYSIIVCLLPCRD